MSFILDALKKSESERKRQDTPGIASIPETSQQPGKPRWPWLVVGLLVINLAVLAAIMMRPDRPTETPTAETINREPATAAESFSDIVREAKRATPEPTAKTVTAPQPEPAAIVPATAPQAAPTQTVTEGLPTFNDLRASGQLQLPDMHLDIHVYSGQPADRFVFVNMSKYKESATLSEGPRISEIVPDGVVLDYMGTRFLLPRE
ncbi:MAG: general secretion pathway protein GspB [Gammaproteobacteria bacterium]|nr:general secretion pathway protein GspB [Gammaproteobacteria bacterium]